MSDYLTDLFIDEVKGSLKDGCGSSLGESKSYTDEKTEETLSEAKEYTDNEVANLVGAAPETLDTLEELAAAIKNNDDVVEVLNEAIGNKAAKDGSNAEGNWNINVSTAEKLQTPRKINGVDFDGSSDITVYDKTAYQEVTCKMAGVGWYRIMIGTGAFYHGILHIARSWGTETPESLTLDVSRNGGLFNVSVLSHEGTRKITKIRMVQTTSSPYANTAYIDLYYNSTKAGSMCLLVLDKSNARNFRVNSELSTSDQTLNIVPDTLEEGYTSTEYNISLQGSYFAKSKIDELRVGNIIATETIQGNARTATKAEQDSDGNVISETYQKKEIGLLINDPWTKVQDSSIFKSVAYGNNKFVAVGEGKVCHSTDGINWELANVPGLFSSVAYGNNKFVAVGWYDIYDSTDGVSWNSVDIDFRILIADYDIGNPSYKTITYGISSRGEGTFVVGSDHGFVLFSTDGIEWEAGHGYEVGENDRIFSSFNTIACNNDAGFFIGHGSNGLFYSSDGEAWFQFNNFSYSFNDMTYANEMFVAVGADGIYYSTDFGDEWIHTCQDSSNFKSVAYGNNMFFASSEDGGYYSKDGIKWTRIDDSIDFMDIVCANDMFVSIGSDGIYNSKIKVITKSLEEVISDLYSKLP